MRDPVTGPLSREKLHELADAPFGAALKEIRKFDPLYGIRDGDLVKWRVKATRMAREDGVAEVEAASIEGAKRLAEELDADDFDWDEFNSDIGDLEIEDVAPWR